MAKYESIENWYKPGRSHSAKKQKDPRRKGPLASMRIQYRGRPAFFARFTFAVITLVSVISTNVVSQKLYAESSVTYRLVDGETVRILETFRECEICPEMIVLPMGSFMMGARLEDSRNPFDFYGEDATGRIRGIDEINIIPNEHPQHEVEVDIPFAIAANELTHAEWMACVDDGGCMHDPDHRAFTPNGYAALGPNHPVVNVSYHDIQEYVGWLNSKIGRQVYRLPTEAEWEYAARAGTTSRFAQGDELTAEQANFSRSATENVRREQEMPHLTERHMPVEVESLDAANQWGVRHMSGNVGEWTQSCWYDEHLGLGTTSEYLENAMSNPDCDQRVAKGGANGTAMDGLRPASRSRRSANTRRDHIGFRLIRVF